MFSVLKVSMFDWNFKRIPTLTFVSTIECGEYLGMEPILVDSSKDGFLMDLNRLLIDF